MYLNTWKVHAHLVEFGILSVPMISENLGSFPQGQWLPKRGNLFKEIVLDGVIQVL